jgi:hypothetical protein
MEVEYFDSSSAAEFVADSATERAGLRACRIIGYKISIDVPGGTSIYPSKSLKNWQFLSCSLVSNIFCINIHKYVLCLVLRVYI